jgi:hypothetical protein
VKLAVDVRRGILAGGGTLHADCETVLLDDGGKQEDIWGADWYPSTQDVTYEALINLRPGQGNFSMEIGDDARPRSDWGDCSPPSWRSMTDWVSIRERYLKDGVDVRLGGLAANLARIGTLSRRDGYSDVASRLVVESGLFIEWTARDVPIATLVELAELQRVLSRWHHAWSELWRDETRREAVAGAATDWSRRVLDLSGLLARGA